MSTLESILPHLAPALLVIFRIGGLMIYGPLFGSPVVPVKVKVLLSFLLGAVTYPVLDASCFAGVQPRLEVWSLTPLIAMELLVGLVIGFVASLPLIALQLSGLITGQQIGLGFAQLYNPTMDDEAEIVGQMLFFMGLSIFLIAGGHQWMILAALDSFRHVPVGGFAADRPMLDLVTGVTAASLELSLRIVAPLLAIVFLETVAMGFLTKTVPQMNIMSLGFPIRILVGLGVVGVGLVVISDVAMEGIQENFTSLLNWIDHPGAR